MPISIRNPRAEALARKVAARAGENMTEAVIHSLEERLARLQTAGEKAALIRKIKVIARRCSSRPTLDTRSADEIIGYDEIGLPR